MSDRLSRQASTAIFGTTRLPSSQVMALAAAAARDLRSQGMHLVEDTITHDLCVWRIESYGFLGGGGIKGPVHGLVTAHSSALEEDSYENGYFVRMEPDTVTVIQAKALGVIPAGPKLLIGFKLYYRFLNDVAAAIRDADRDSTLQWASPGREPAGLARIGSVSAHDAVRGGAPSAGASPQVPGWLGVTTVAVSRSGKLGAEVASVAAGSAAEDAGLLPGDLIVAVGGRAIASAGALPRILETMTEPTVVIGWERGDKYHRASVDVAN
jgi:membrane-associated protease RseP (regulator of RpoE activity)